MALNRFEPIDIVQPFYFPGFTIIHAILIHKEKACGAEENVVRRKLVPTISTERVS